MNDLTTAHNDIPADMNDNQGVALIPKRVGRVPENPTNNTNLHSLDSLQDQIVQDIQCGDESILLMCDESTFNPSEQCLNDLLHLVFCAYHRAIQTESIDNSEEFASHYAEEIQVTLGQALLFFRETAFLDNSLHHADVIVEFYKLSLEIRAASSPTDVSVQIADEHKSSRKLSLTYIEFLRLLDSCMHLRGLHDAKTCVHSFCTTHLPYLQKRAEDGMKWIICQAINPELIQVSKLAIGGHLHSHAGVNPI